MKKLAFASLILAVGISACKKDTKKDDTTPAPVTNNCPPANCVDPDTIWTPTSSAPSLVFKFKFDSTQVRLDGLGNPSTIPAGNAGFSPLFNKMSTHYIELAQGDLTPFGGGKILYKAAETTCDKGENAITFCQSKVVREGVTFFSIPLSQIAGTYKWLRVSLAYQNYDIAYKTVSCTNTQYGTVASFIGFNNYVKQYKVKTQTIVPTASLTTSGSSGGGNVKQGYWGFESNVCSSFMYTVDGKAAGTTVVNPNPSSPIPAGSCVVTGQFYKTSAGMNQPLVITGSETSDIVITVSLSTNKSFEWKEVTADGYYQPQGGEFPVDMGIRGMIAKY
ncbi:MAG: hypothetical protein ACXVP0_17095 [Bacteroidia bacterium]